MDSWFYAWLRAKKLCENKGELVLSPSDAEDKLFEYIARGYHGKASGRHDRLVKHIELSRHFAEAYLEKSSLAHDSFAFMAGFVSALQLLESAAKKG